MKTVLKDKASTVSEKKLEEINDKVLALMKEYDVVGVCVFSCNDKEDNSVAGVVSSTYSNSDTAIDEEGEVHEFSKLDDTMAILYSMADKLKIIFKRIDLAVDALHIVKALNPKEKSPTT